MNRKPVTDALIELIVSSTNRPCGDHRSPPDGVLEDGYTFLYSIEGGSFDGAPLGPPEPDATLVYQVNSIGASREQVEQLAERVRATLIGRDNSGGYRSPFPILSGLKVINRASQGFLPGVISDGPTGREVYSIPERYRISVAST